ncbi:MAG: flagellar basal body P-ring formation chaperone FlgA [Candidatus Adiutrix sp.]|jgi:flagella basal body P-ring formation protein FlgA|nr:flagellar basal body P-ring formation chaperone FlgA [Candidatus Adiutrix sp.]
MIAINFKKIWLFVWLFVWLGGAGTLWAAQVSVIIPAENTVSGPRIVLGDIASVNALIPEGEALAQALSAIDLGAAPEPGRELLLRRAQLEQRLVASRLNLSEASWALPEELRLTGRGQDLSEDLLRQALGKYMAETEPYKSGRFELVSVSFGSLPGLAPGKVQYRFVPQPSSNPTYLSGAFFFNVDGQDAGRVRVTAQVDLSIEALVAARPLNKGQILDEADLSLTFIPYSQAKGALTALEAALGSTLKVNLSAGDPLKDRNLAKSLMVQRGDLVTLVAQQGALTITASGQAKEGGALGDTISILNLSSKKTVTGRIIGPDQVEIVF